ncbi:hypothetical protein BLNAU_15581 [Blattamonas nauphoetae]|uniref:AMP-activated protein kinase glycogen-binding domain-containing protein n=1 Tax=Blattamonas nauphoetae TaxID=2049346 RepID=A0ABQ9XAD1_9EUKA|nr:hypothetical protein BLNAU_15581 [Blattamonas nauphoetae]
MGNTSAKEDNPAPIVSQTSSRRATKKEPYSFTESEGDLFQARDKDLKQRPQHTFNPIQTDVEPHNSTNNSPAKPNPAAQPQKVQPESPIRPNCTSPPFPSNPEPQPVVPEDPFLELSFTWTYGAVNSVFIAGSFNQWKNKIALTAIRSLNDSNGPSHTDLSSGNYSDKQRQELETDRLENDGKTTKWVKKWSIAVKLRPGTYYYKFIVDNQWRHDPHLPNGVDTAGTQVNILTLTPNNPQTPPKPTVQPWPKPEEPNDTPITPLASPSHSKQESDKAEHERRKIMLEKVFSRGYSQVVPPQEVFTASAKPLTIPATFRLFFDPLQYTTYHHIIQKKNYHNDVHISSCLSNQYRFNHKSFTVVIYQPADSAKSESEVAERSKTLLDSLLIKTQRQTLLDYATTVQRLSTTTLNG